MIKKDHDEIWYWHQKIEEFHASGLGVKEYCDKHEVNYQKFSNMKHRIEYKKYSNPQLYKRSVPIARAYMESGISASKFAKDNDINIKLLGELGTHLQYVDIIEERKKSAMKFVQVPQAIPKQETEILEKQNDIEITITKGVKVSISPNIDSMKIIKIIELLKDL
jgi:hypothetical protein